MRLLAVFCVASLAAFPSLFAETPPSSKPVPAKVDAALRARVTDFYQSQMAGNFRKSYDLVSKESQDYFLSISKEKATVFKIDAIEYRDKFSRAVVKVATTNHVLVGFHAIDLPTFAVSYWKVEGGKWVWYHDPEQDRPNFFGLPVGEVSKSDAALAQSVPKDTSPEATAAAAKAALSGANDKPFLDKLSLQFILGTEDTQEVSVHNAFNGEVRLVVYMPEESIGVFVEPAEVKMEAFSDTTLKFHYLPLYREPANAEILFRLRPFPKVYSLPVTIAPPAQPEDPKK
jgi:hypothetical protein